MKNTIKVSGFAVIIAAIVLNALLITGCPPPPEEEPTVVSIEITKQPGKTTYYVGDDLDTTGMEVTATYSDDKKEAVTGYTVTGYDKNKAETQTITVTYEGKTATFSVTVKPLNTFDSAPGLTLAADDTKLTYTWTKSEPDADSYDVYWKEGSGLTAADVKTGTKIAGASSSGEITGLTNDTAYSVLVTASKAYYISRDSEVQTAVPTGLYIITGSDAKFTARKGSAAVGEAEKPIQDVITAIRTDAAGKAVKIQFGDGTDALNIDTASASFNNTGGAWGLVTLSGKITGSSIISSAGTITIAGDVSITSTADIANTAVNSNARAIYSNTTGALTISGGTVTATSGYTVYNNTGALTISGGMLTATSGYTVYNNTGALTISGGTVTATSGYAVRNSTGTVNISGGTVSATASWGYAVYNQGAGTVNISGGSIQALTTSTIGYAVINSSSGTINISGGEVLTGVSTAVNNSGSGAVNISGGEVKAGTGNAVNNGQGKITVSGTSTKVSSANTSATQGTIFLANNGTATAVRLEITGGTVENTSTTNGNAIRNDSTGAVTISGGTVSKAGTNGYAVNNTSTGVVTITKPPAVITGAVTGVEGYTP